MMSGQHHVMPTPSNLSLISVKFGSAALLERNVQLVHDLNPDTNFSWLVVNNDFEPNFRLRGVEVLAGVPKPHASDKGSTHHALALNLALNAVKTRYVVLLDHDFFVLRPNWIGETFEHLHQHKLAALASQWHPRWSYQPQRLPSVHFLLLDLEQFSGVDFRPDFFGNRFDALVSSPHLPLPAALRTLLQTGAYRDTGWRLLEQFKTRAFMCLDVAVDLPRLERGAPWLYRLAQRVLPPSWSPLPKTMRGYTDAHFLPPQAQELGWEEFFWQGRPFAFHLRRVGNATNQDDTALLEQILADSALTQKRYS
jgi:hypothetical protein